ncbi:hypothetical protein AB0E01_36545 [Nocardia vinacea]|uniref:hypothetical protein n=1 Tax=Nocardia vinacea TaxID=96468 RepID=UPI0033F69287
MYYCDPTSRARLGVRMRILAIALVPSLTLLVVGVSAAGYLVEGNGGFFNPR